MRRFLVLALCLWPAWAAAQSAPVVRWTHAGTNVSHFQIQIGTNQFVDVGLPTPTGNVYQATLPTLPTGQHALKVRACYGPTSSCVASASPVTVVVHAASGSTAKNLYWVSPTGAATWANCKSDAPLSGTAACARDTANANAAAGDTVYFRAGTYTVAGSGLDYEGIQPANDGTDGNPITFAAYGDETPIITATAANTYGIYLSGTAYVRILGFTFRDVKTWAYILGTSHHNEFAFNTFESTAGNEAGNGIILSSSIGGSCGTSKDCWITHNWFHDNAFSKRVNPDPCSEGVDLVRVGANVPPNSQGESNNYNSFDDNLFAYVGHTVLDNFGTYTVIRNNVSHNEPWIEGCTNYQDGTSTSSVTIGTGSKSLTATTGKTWTSGDSIGLVQTSNPANAMSGTVTSYNSGTGALVVNVTYSTGSGTHTDWTVSHDALYPYYTTAAYNGKYGHRNFQLSDDYSRESTHVLMEGNRLGHASNNPGNAGPMNLDAAAPKNLIRYNDIFAGMSSGLYFKYATSSWLPCDGVRDSNGDCGGVHNRVYHNTITKNGYGYDWRAYGHKNNAMSRLGIAQWNAAGTGTTGNVIVNNLLYDNAEGDICELGLYSSTCTPATYDTVANNWVTTNGNPAFVDLDVSDPTSTTLPDLRLQVSSGAIDAAPALTQANGAGSSSTTLVVDDAWLFQDGTRGSDLARAAGRMHADWIAVGTVGNVVEIASINYATNTITLATATTWADNASIWLARKSDGVTVLVGSAPDYGAHEYGNGTVSAPSGVGVQ